MLRARPHLHYAPVPGGVYLAGARAELVLRGSDALFTVADACVPLLEDGASEDDLVAALGTERARPAVRHVVAQLRRHDLLLDEERFTVPAPPAPVRERHPEVLAHLEAVSDDPYAAFARLRAAVVVLAGPGEAVEPAARSLRRNAVGEVRAGGAGTDPAGADVVLLCLTTRPGAPGEDGLDAAAAALERTLAAGAPVVPLLLDDRAVLAGPAVRDATGAAAWRGAARRVLSRAGAGVGSEGRPVADALGGALSAGLLLDEIAGVGEPGAAHVVHGPDLADERVVVPGVAAPWPTGPQVLRDAHDGAAPDEDEGLAAAEELTGRWTGPVELLPGTDLLQLPLALRLAQVEVAGETVVGAGDDQRAATLAAVLEALRTGVRHDGPGDGPEEEVPDGVPPYGAPPRGVAAAGTTRGRWLLDAALRVLAADARPVPEPGDDPVAEAGPQAARLRDAYVATGAPPPQAGLLRVPGVDWVLARLADPATGVELGSAWGVDAAAAVTDALAAALVPRLVPEAHLVPGTRTDALVRADDATVAALAKQVIAVALADALRFEGRRHRDPVLGDGRIWSGAVRARPLHEDDAPAGARDEEDRP
ncbi:hypothetical protein D5H78_04660 [Vallicoccus soli]|uniref:Uncharacterized protein n=1 Tax=Vallicoccus soli TaxID=2339232 RepID=A0A3A3ZN46_9ACTN|nr:hypothetical protein D5H78_04660 [Vallicoccus soli]